MKQIVLKCLQSTLFKLFLTLIFGFFFGHYLPTEIQSFFYALSLSLKEILVFILPIIIFSCLFSCLLSFPNNVLKFIVVLLLAICVSNFFSTIIGFNISKTFFSDLPSMQKDLNQTSSALEPLWSLKLPQLVTNNFALFSGLILGLIFSFFKNQRIEKISVFLKNAVTLFLNKIFVPVLPFFALGFIIKLEQDGILSLIIKSYFPLVIAIFSTQIIYILFLYFAAAKFKFGTFLNYLKNVSPAGLMGFSTMSSMAALPLTIQAAEKNTQNLNFPRTIAPATVNVHLIGDSIAIPIIALAILSTFSLPFPDFSTFLIFALFFVLAKFAVAGIPGGGIIVMIPILEKYLGFNSEMSGLITAIYILLDPVVTTANVLGNGAFTIIMTKIFQFKK